MPPRRPSRNALALALLLLGLVGCNAPGQPTLRMGALPFPGQGLYTVADPADLGHHRYWTPFQFADGEVGRGIVYTEKAGFVDVAHVRDTADWTRYFADRIRPALAAGRTTLVVGGPDRSKLHLRFDYPPGWDDLAGSERRRVLDDVSLRAAQETAYAVASWHELITWYDYGVLPGVSERHSAFAYDDVMSHVLGLEVARRAIAGVRAGEDDYNSCVTAALVQVLREQGASTPEQTKAATRAVRGDWWVDGVALKRHADLGLDDGRVVPMLVSAGPGTPEEFALPRVADAASAGLDLSGFFSLEIEPRLKVYRRLLRGRLDGEPVRIVPARDIPRLMQTVQQEMRDEFGPLVNTVGPTPPTYVAHYDER